MNKIVLWYAIPIFPLPFKGEGQDERSIFARQSGFTLIEFMVSLLILSLVIGGGYALFSAGRTFWFSQGTAIAVQDYARQALDYMAMELTSAVDIDSNPATRLTIDPLRTASVNSIAFKHPVYCDGDGIWLDIDNDNLGDYYLESAVNPQGIGGAGGVEAGIDAGAYAPSDIDPQTGQLRYDLRDASRRNRRIIYSIGGLNNSQLIRTVESPAGVQLDTRVLANDVTGLRIRRRNSFTAPALEQRIIVVELDISKNIYPGRSGPNDPVNDITMITRIALRNE